MQKDHFKSIKLALLILFLGLIVSANANAARYYFSQDFTDDFNDNGHVTGYFDGEDGLDGSTPDGKIVGGYNVFSLFDEVSNFGIRYSGNAFFSKFNCGNDCGAYLQDLTYDINNNSLQSLISYDENNGWNVDYSIYGDAGAGQLGFVLFDGANPISLHIYNSTGPVTVSTIPPIGTPIPGAIWLFLPSFAWLFRFKVKKNNQNSKPLIN
ncbi:MAG: hypothetical protein ABL933_15375 [Methyloglobulus sp.]|nr:hypothetical protein [Methyloglobulus sp.]